MGDSQADAKYYQKIKENDAKFGVITNIINNLFPTVYGVNGTTENSPSSAKGAGKDFSCAAAALGILEGLIKGKGGFQPAGPKASTSRTGASPAPEKLRLRRFQA